MEMKNFFKTAIFAGTLAVGLTAAINFAPNVEAAAPAYNQYRSYTTYGKSNLGVANGVMYDVESFYDCYVSPESQEWDNIDGMNVTKNACSENFYFGKRKKWDISGCRGLQVPSDYNDYNGCIFVNGDDPITAFVDRDCLKYAGDYLFVGEEYGYFVHTIQSTEEDQENDYTTSVILLLDFKHSFESTNFPKRVYSNFDVKVVSQTAVVTLNYKRINDIYWSKNKDYVAWIPNEDNSHEVRQIYMKGNDIHVHADGYLVAPVLMSGYETNDSCRIPATYSQLWASNLCYRANFTDTSKKEIPYNYLNLEGNWNELRYNYVDENDLITESDIERVWNILKETYGSTTASELRNKVISYIPYGNYINIGIDYVEATIDFFKMLHAPKPKAHEESQLTNRTNLHNIVENTYQNSSIDFRLDTIGVTPVRTSGRTTGYILAQELLGKCTYDVTDRGSYSYYKDSIRFVNDFDRSSADIIYKISFMFSPMIRKWNAENNTYEYTLMSSDNLTIKKGEDGNKAAALNIDNHWSIYNFINVDKSLFENGDLNQYQYGNVTILDVVMTKDVTLKSASVSGANGFLSISLWEYQNSYYKKLLYHTDYNGSPYIDVKLKKGYRYVFWIRTRDGLTPTNIKSVGLVTAALPTC